jgi:hypothetical protein
MQAFFNYFFPNEKGSEFFILYKTDNIKSNHHLLYFATDYADYTDFKLPEVVFCEILSKPINLNL